MADYKTDEEKVEDLKAWWNENGSSVVVGVLIAVVGLFSWQYWLSYSKTHSEEASLLFSQLETKPTDQVLQKLTTNYDRTPYATLAALAVAKMQAEKGENNKAIKNLNWVVENGIDPQFQNIAQLRLARLYLAIDKFSEADKLLQYQYATAYSSLVDELKGDLYVAKKELNKARKAYDRAIISANNNTSDYLQMKRDDLGEGS